MSLSELLNRFSLVSGFDRENISVYLPVIIDAKVFFEEKTKDRQLSAADLRRLTHACAVYAYYKIALCRNSECLTSFKAGDLSFSVENMREQAKLLWEQEKAQSGDILPFADTDFSFESVVV